MRDSKKDWSWTCMVHVGQGVPKVGVTKEYSSGGGCDSGDTVSNHEDY